MDRDIPTFNQLIVNKINQKNRQLHERRLQNIRTSQQSRSYLSSSMNSRQNRKAQQLEEDKKTEIQKHNLMLFNKMKKIMNRNDPQNRPLTQNQKNYNRMSVELTKIQEENRTMYDRIEKQRPTINNKKLFQERQKHLNILKFLGKYSAHSIQSTNAQNAQNLRTSQTSSRTNANFFPDQRKKAYTSKPEHYLQNTQAEINSNLQTKPRYEQLQFDEEINDQDFNRIKALMQAKNQKKSSLHQRQQKEQNQDEYISKPTTLPQKRLAELRPSVPKSAKEIILFRTNTQISGFLYEIRILRKHLTYEIRCSMLDSPEQPLRIQFSEEIGNQLLEESNYDYKAIIDRLTIKNNELVFDSSNPDIKESRGGPLKSEEGDLIPVMKPRKKNQFLFANASHISQLNEQDSYQVQVLEKRQQIKEDEQNSLDSLGQEEQFEKFTQEEMQLTQDNAQFNHKPANFQEKLQQNSRQESHFQNQHLQIGNKFEVEPNNYEETSQLPQENDLLGHYEQALDESIE